MAGTKNVRIGVDVGGTNTDAVAVDPSQQFEASRGILAHYKTPTTPDVTEGIEIAVRTVLEKSALPTDRIASVTVGTTHFINAIIEQDTRRLRRVAILRLSKSFLREVPPFSDWPPGLTSIIKGYVGYCDGGLHIDGSEEAPIVESQIVERCAEIKKLGLSAVVIVGAFSPIDEVFQQENRVREIVMREIPGADVVVSHEVANIGLLERENASILNTSTIRYAKRTVKGFRRAMKALDLTCPLFLTQNDGTLLDSAAAANTPIRTFSSGATNSMRGAAYLAGHETGSSSAIVVDIGGTTSDVGVLLPSGLPRQASAYVTVAGVRVNYSMPHLHSIGLGGGSIVRQTDGKVTVGPDSVGHYLTRDALVFGGRVATASDVTVAAGKTEMGDKHAVEGMDRGMIVEAQQCMKKLIEGAIDIIKTSPEPLPVLLVGGGAVLAPTSLAGASELVRRRIADEPPVDPCTYTPTVVKNERTGAQEWLVTETDIKFLADGCYVLGCAGGGSPAASRIQLRDMLRAGHKMRIIDASTLSKDAVVYWGGHMGSPATSNERLQSLETVHAFRELMDYLRHDSFDAVMGLEIGGANGLEPFLVGSSRFFDRPVIDGDWMGRAYPTYWQTTLAVHAPGELVPCVIDSGDGKTILMTKASNDEIVDRALRGSCAEMGSRVGMAAKPTTTDRVQRFGVLNTVSLAWRIGRCIARAEATNTLSTVAEAIVDEVGGTKSAKILFRGKIVGVERRLFKGHSYGSITIAGLAASEEDASAENVAKRLPAVVTGGTLTIPFKNENIYAEHTADDGTKTIIASVPDLIAVLDTGSGRSLGVPEFKYGFRVSVVGITCSKRWTETAAGLAIGGPKAFGYDIEYKPLGEYVEPRSVIEEYATA
ncbi:hypothetical protein LTR08_004194 [Meristemomyces frigidus]|nr:hypothetical protein LTR08_004194 [Meristemomyces frigidus]